jgi:glutaredoxin
MILANGQSFSGAKDILDYLEAKYSSSQSVDTTDRASTTLAATAKLILRDMGSYLAVLLRYGRGRHVIAAARPEYPEQPLTLYSYEGNQFCRLVREVLCELDVPYELRNAGKQSPRRAELAKRGSTLCPFLVDPNTGTSMPESKEIVAYLYQTYARWTPPNEVLQWASDVVLPTVRPLLAWVAPLQAGSRGADPRQYAQSIQEATSQINAITASHPVVVYTYDLSPFCTETKALLDRLKIEYIEVSLGLEWIPGLLNEPVMRAALLEKTGQSSLPHIFIGGESIGGLFSGTPGLVPLLEQDQLMNKLTAVQSKSNVFGKKS